MAVTINLLYVIFLLAVVPVMAHHTARREELLLLPRKSLYFSAVLSQWLLALLTVLIVLFTSAPLAGVRAIAWGDFTRWTAGLLGASLAGIGLGLLLEGLGWWPEESALVRRLIPRTPGEKLWALFAVAPTAGVCEEFIFRGYLLPNLNNLTHSIALAWALSSIAFGLCHAYQNFSGAARATLLGALLAAPVVFVHSLYPAVAAHFLIDVAGLLWIGPASLKTVTSDN
ncbi:MAG: CPBP family intramembrane glutamic endopeptidase [Terriglobia bacterium]